MPRFLIERALGDIDHAELERGADASTKVRLEQFPQIDHEHTHVVRTEEGLTAFCVYRADGPDVLREHAEASSLPAGRILEIETDLEPPAHEA